MLKRSLLTLGLIFLLALGAGAQDSDDDVINTDSPSLTNSCHVVGTGTVQLESGLYYVSANGTPPSRGPRGRDDPSADESLADQYAVPYLFRIGLSDDFELRLNGDLLQFQGRDFGYSDLGVGFKYRLVDNPEGLSFAVLGNLDLPVGTGDFRGIGFSPQLDLIADFPLDEDTAMVLNLGAALDAISPNGPSFLDYFAGAAVSRQLTENWSGYLELAALGPFVPQGGTLQTVVDGGLSYTVNNDWVLNLAVFRGLSNTGMNWGGYVGYGAKW